MTKAELIDAVAKSESTTKADAETVKRATTTRMKFAASSTLEAALSPTQK